MSENQPVPPDRSSQRTAPASPVAADQDGQAQTGVADTPFQLSQEPVTAETEAPASHEPPAPAPAYEHLGELPATYGTQSVYLVAYDPRQLFAYWDLDWSTAPGAAFFLHVRRADGTLESRGEIRPAEAGRYLTAGVPGGTYYVELGAYGRDGAWQPLATSGRVTMPPEGIAGETEPKFATLPFHLSFQRLLELIDGAMHPREDLAATLARLQHGGHPDGDSLRGALSHLTDDQVHTLEALLGRHAGALADDAGTSPGGSSEQSVLRDRHDALLAPGESSAGRLAALGGGSESLSSGAFGSEALSSSALAGGLSSETLASGAYGSEALAAFGVSALSSEALSSGALAAFGVSALSSEALSSGALARDFGSETLASFVAGLSSETLAGFAALLAGGSESLGSGALLGHGPSSEAWRMAAAGGGLSSSDLLASGGHAEMFRQALASNLDVMGVLFSHVHADLTSGSFGSSDGGSGSGGFGAGSSSPFTGGDLSSAGWQ